MNERAERVQDSSSRAAFEAMSDIVLSIAAELSLEPVLRKLVEAARELAGARYAAIGVPDEDGDRFAHFVTTGLTRAQEDAIGPLPQRHGLLGAMLRDTEPYRTEDVSADPRFSYFPSAHPRMRSLLGVPILSKGDVVGLFYLADKRGAHGFQDADLRIIELLAAHAAIAIENARLYELSRELTVTDARERMARELHDSMNQRLFSLVLTAETAAATVRSDPGGAEANLQTVKDLARETLAELRALIAGLRPPALEEEGLAVALAKHVEVLRTAHRATIGLHVGGDGRMELDAARQVLRIAQEALQNALRHAQARVIRVEVTQRGSGVTLTVRDDGVGFDPADRAAHTRRLGLTSMRERARTAGGTLTVTSKPGHGTTVQLAVPGG
jgi:signal transduction histidine kinase